MKQNNRLNRKTLVRTIAHRANCTTSEAEHFLSAFIEVARESLENGKGFSLNNFGSFTVKDSPAHNGYNPVAGKHEVFPARKCVKFIISKNVKLPE